MIHDTESLQTEYDRKEYRKFYKKVDYLIEPYKPKNRNIRAQDRTLLMEEYLIVGRWREYFQGRQHNMAPVEYYENER
jgi:hypothetical protein